MKVSLEEIQQAIADLEKMGLVEWSGEWRTGKDGARRKVYRAAGTVQ
jgi:hypothetical protein